MPGKRLTLYRTTTKDNRAAWEAVSEQSASMWRQTVHVPPEQLGDVRFSWWVANLLPGADLSSSSDEDAPARVIFAFDGDHAKLSLRNRMLFELASSLSGETPPYATLAYAWSNDLPAETVVNNPRTDRIRTIVLESGGRNLGRWRDYQRRLADDFRKVFGEEPGPLIGIAVMTDTDNTQTAAKTWYGDVRLLQTAAPSAGPAKLATTSAH